MKKFKIFVATMAIVMVSTILVGCNSLMDKQYFNKVSSYTFWENEGSQSIAQYNIHNIVYDHINDDNGKTKKVAILGYDGMRADALINIRNSGIKADSDTYDIYTGVNQNAKYSAINHIMDNGGKAYMMYCGGEKSKSSKQATSTAPGWASVLTGAWGEKNGVLDNGDVKNMEYKTFLLKLAEDKNMRTAFMSSWSVHFNETYKDEVDYVQQKALPMQFYKANNDADLHEKLLLATGYGQEERDVIFGIYEATDYNGHYTNFSNTNSHYVNGARNADNNIYEIIQSIQSRPTYEQEDWLFVLTSDHGGMRTGHGGQTLEERNIFLITNKAVDTKYYSTNYNGYNAG